jgi:ABC-type transporter MlaC component
VRGKCTVTAEAKGKSKAELQQIAEEFSQKVTQCFSYNKVVTQLKSKGFSMVNEEVMSDNGIRIHVRQAE